MEDTLTSEQFGQRAGALLEGFIRSSGKHYGEVLWMMAHKFGDGLTEELMKSTIIDLRGSISRALQGIPGGMGLELLAREPIRKALYDQAEAAMLGRYQALVDNPPGGAA